MTIQVDMEDAVKEILSAFEFIFSGYTMEDDIAIRAMLVYGATEAQITRALVFAAMNPRVAEQDKVRYAFGCIRNEMERAD